MEFEIITAILEALRLAYPNAYNKDDLINAALCELSPATTTRESIYSAIITARDRGQINERHGVSRRVLYSLTQAGRAALEELTA